MKKIKLTQSRFACVDDEDFEWLSQWNWHYHRNKKISKTGYARRRKSGSGQPPTIRMHVAIMKRHKLWRHRKQIEHVDTCGCDNRKVNLRLATQSENSGNAGLSSNNTSGITGVHWYKTRKQWRSFIRIKRKWIHLGYFIDKEKAIKARQQAEVKYFREFQHDPTNICPLGYTSECPECAQRLKELQDE